MSPNSAINAITQGMVCNFSGDIGPIASGPYAHYTESVKNLIGSTGDDDYDLHHKNIAFANEFLKIKQPHEYTIGRNMDLTSSSGHPTMHRESIPITDHSPMKA